MYVHSKKVKYTTVFSENGEKNHRELLASQNSWYNAKVYDASGQQSARVCPTASGDGPVEQEDCGQGGRYIHQNQKKGIDVYISRQFTRVELYRIKYQTVREPASETFCIIRNIFIKLKVDKLSCFSAIS